MTVTYDWDEHIQTCTCGACGYKHTQEMGFKGKTLEGDELFIEMDFTLHSDNNSIYPSDSRSYSMYACPKCGVLQIRI